MLKHTKNRRSRFLRVFKNRAFTLFEVLLAIALGGLIFVAASSLLVSFTQFWLRNEHLEDFENHMRSVLHFAENALHQACYTLDPKLPNAHFSWIPGENQMIMPPKLSFIMNAPHPLLTGIAGGPTQVYLYLEPKQGLYLAYHPYYKNADEAPQALYAYRLSAFVTQLNFIYTDKDKAPVFSEAPTTKDRVYPMASFLQLIFEDKEGEAHSFIIPVRKAVESQNAGLILI